MGEGKEIKREERKVDFVFLLLPPPFSSTLSSLLIHTITAIYIFRNNSKSGFCLWLVCVHMRACTYACLLHVSRLEVDICCLPSSVTSLCLIGSFPTDPEAPQFVYPPASPGAFLSSPLQPWAEKHAVVPILFMWALWI